MTASDGSSASHLFCVASDARSVSSTRASVIDANSCSLISSFLFEQMEGSYDSKRMGDLLKSRSMVRPWSLTLENSVPGSNPSLCCTSTHVELLDFEPTKTRVHEYPMRQLSVHAVVEQNEETDWRNCDFSCSSSPCGWTALELKA